MYDYGLTYKQKFTHESGAAVRSNTSFSPACSGALLKKCLLFAPQLEMQPPLPMLSSYSGTGGFTPTVAMAFKSEPKVGSCEFSDAKMLPRIMSGLMWHAMRTRACAVLSCSWAMHMLTGLVSDCPGRRLYMQGLP